MKRLTFIRLGMMGALFTYLKPLEAMSQPIDNSIRSLRLPKPQPQIRHGMLATENISTTHLPSWLQITVPQRFFKNGISPSGDDLIMLPIRIGLESHALYFRPVMGDDNINDATLYQNNPKGLVTNKISLINLESERTFTLPANHAFLVMSGRVRAGQQLLHAWSMNHAMCDMELTASRQSEILIIRGK